MRLYDDVEPLRLAGYASAFEVDYLVDAGSAWERVARGAFSLNTGRAIALCVAHLNEGHDKRLAWTGDRSLRLWQDGHGLAFEASITWNDGALPLASAMRRGELIGCSVGFARREVETVRAGDREVEVVRKAELAEISLTWAPACPCTAVWVEDEAADELPAYVAQARAYWLAGRIQAELAAARRPAARARAAAAAGLARAAAGREARASAVPASVLRVLARYGPRGA